MRKYAREHIFVMLYYIIWEPRGALKLTVPLMGTARSGAAEWKCSRQTDRQTDGSKRSARSRESAEKSAREKWAGWPSRQFTYLPSVRSLESSSFLQLSDFSWMLLLCLAQGITSAITKVTSSRLIIADRKSLDNVSCTACLSENSFKKWGDL